MLRHDIISSLTLWTLSLVESFSPDPTHMLPQLVLSARLRPIK